MKGFAVLTLALVTVFSLTACFERDIPSTGEIKIPIEKNEQITPEENYEVKPLINPDGMVEGDPIPEEDMSEPVGVGNAQTPEEDMSEPVGVGNAQTPEEDMSELVGVGNAQTPEEEMSESVGVGNAQTPEEAVTLLGADMIRSLYKEGENLLVSPVSVSLALGLTAGGSGGETFDQLESVLGRGVSFHDMQDFYYRLNEELDDSDSVEINVANSLWIRESGGVEPRRSYLQFADKYFDADVFREKFDSKTLKKINNWVKDETDGMIPSLLDEINEQVVMYIINALSFESEWEREYKADKIYKTFRFTDSDGNTKTVTGMGSEESVYLEDENAVGFVKNYRGGEYGFAVLLPNEDVTVSDYVKSLTGERLTEIFNNKITTKVFAKFPKFKVEYKTTLNDTLKAMGVEDAFDPYKADFTELTEGDIYVSQVLHKTFIEVAEKGTRAAAVTAVEMPKGMAPVDKQDETKRITVDRPFVFAIIDNTTSLPLFMGVVSSVE